ncbi:MAG: hypothetical protein WCB67_05385 [Solirubrobacteraceae bacterium]
MRAAAAGVLPAALDEVLPAGLDEVLPAGLDEVLAAAVDGDLRSPVEPDLRAVAAGDRDALAVRAEAARVREVPLFAVPLFEVPLFADALFAELRCAAGFALDFERVPELDFGRAREPDLLPASALDLVRRGELLAASPELRAEDFRGAFEDERLLDVVRLEAPLSFSTAISILPIEIDIRLCSATPGQAWPGC